MYILYTYVYAASSVIYNYVGTYIFIHTHFIHTECIVYDIAYYIHTYVYMYIHVHGALTVYMHVRIYIHYGKCCMCYDLVSLGQNSSYNPHC